MDVFTIECFLAVAETKNFTKAAQRVRRTQSAITQRISSLEKQLGTMLFNRQKEISVTENGQIFLSYAVKLYSLFQEMQDRIKEPYLEGKIRFGLPEDFATKFLSDILFHFSKVHPRIHLEVECDLTVNLLNKFKDDKLDMVLVKLISTQDFPNGFEVWSEPLEWITGKCVTDHFTKQNPLPLVVAPEPCIYRARAIEALSEANIPWRIAFTSTSYVGSVAAVEAGMGVSVLPSTLIPNSCKRIQDAKLPSLPDIHVSLLRNSDKKSLDTLEEYLIQKFPQVSYH